MDHISEGERLVKLMLYIKQAGPVSFEDIRSRFPVEYSSKTNNEESVRRRFERDKRSLQRLGVFLKVDADKRYTLDGALSYAAPVDLTPSQASLVRLVCGALLEDENYAFKSELRMVLIKLGDELGIPDLLPQMENPAFEMGGRERKLQGLDKVRKAISQRKLLRFEYRSASGEESSREVEPFGCFVLRENCYVVAYDPHAAGERCFRLNRMSHLSVNATRPEFPDFEERVFDAGKYYGLPFQFGNEDYLARIRFDAEDAWLCEQLAMGQGTFEAEEDGGVIWSIPCRDTHDLVRWCIEHNPEARLIGPPSAVRALEEGISAAVQRLGGNGKEEAR